MGKKILHPNSMSLTVIALSIHAVLYSTSVYAYQQGEGVMALVNEGEAVLRSDELNPFFNPREAYSGLVQGEKNRSGNPVRIIWYGDAGNLDGTIAQKGAKNHGWIKGEVRGDGEDSTTENDMRSTIVIDGQANAIDAYGWTPPNNKNDVVIKLEKVENHGKAEGVALIRPGKGGDDSYAITEASANGFSLYGNVNSGDVYSLVGGIDGSTGGSGITARRARSTTIKPLATTSSTTIAITKAAATPPRDSDQDGKKVQLKLDNLDNDGVLAGKVSIEGNKENEAVNDNRQKYPAVSWYSGNGVSLRSIAATEDHLHRPSESKLNEVVLGKVNNQGVIRGDALLEAGKQLKNIGFSYTRSYGAGNGIALGAWTNRWAQNATKSKISDTIENTGTISGQLKQVSTNNTQPTVHSYSQSQAYGSGNGVSVYTQAENHNSKAAQASIAGISNAGKMLGDAHLQAGDGYGVIAIEALGSGNGVSTYVRADAVGAQDAPSSIGNIDNTGMIVGKIHTRAGIGAESAKDGQSIPEEAARLIVTKQSNVSSNKQPNQVPPKPEQAKSIGYFHPNSSEINQIDATSKVHGSGNGISVYQGNRPTGSATSQLGDIDNRGVVSGYAKMNHGFANEEYARVNFLGTGSGIFVDNKLDSAISNAGIISGNQTALLARGRINDTYSVYNPTFDSGYTKRPENYGIMAGTLIAGNYQSNAAVSHDVNKQSYQYFAASKSQDPNHFDDTDGNPDTDTVDNLGITIHLKEGIADKKSGYWPNEIFERFDDYETIDKIVIGKGGTYTDAQGTNYEIVNAPLIAGGKDSEYAATGDIQHKIINGVGIEHGALIANQDTLIDASIVNGYRTTVNIQGDTSVTSNNSILNANGFDIRAKQQDSYVMLHPYAVLGDAGSNELTLKGNSVVNGDINLKNGDDTLTITDANVHINASVIDMGAGTDALIVGDMGQSATQPIILDSQILNLEGLTVNQSSKILSTLDYVKDITLNDKLVYQGGNFTMQPGDKLVVGVGSKDTYGQLDVVGGDADITEGTLAVNAAALADSALENNDKLVNVVRARKVIGTFSSYSDNSILFDFIPEYDSKGNAVHLTVSKAGDTGTGDTGTGDTGTGDTNASLVNIVHKYGYDGAHDAAVVLDNAFNTDAMSSLSRNFWALSNEKAAADAVLETLPLMMGSANNILINNSRDLSVSVDRLERGSRVWGNIIGNWHDQSGVDGIAGYKSNNRGFVFGADTDVNDRLVLGGKIGYLNSNSDTQDSPAYHTVDIDTFQLGAYATFDIDEHLELDTEVGYGRSNVEGKRHIRFTGKTAESDYKADIAFARLGLTYNTDLSGIQLKPFTQADYRWVKSDAYHEHKAGALNLKVDEDSHQSLLLTTGVKAEYELSNKLDVSGQISINVETLDTQNDIVAYFEGAPNQAFSISSVESGQVIGQIGVQAQYHINEISQVTAQYITAMRKDRTDQQAFIGLRLEF